VIRAIVERDTSNLASSKQYHNTLFRLAVSDRYLSFVCDQVQAHGMPGLRNCVTVLVWSAIYESPRCPHTTEEAVSMATAYAAQ
jgi:hypothetical protein